MNSSFTVKVFDKNIRQSNLELLRLVCMYFIIIHHFLVHGLKFVAGHKEQIPFSLQTVIATSLDSFLFIAVNSFILISGFFSLKLKIKKILHLYILCAGYGTLFYFIHLIIDNQAIGKSILPNSLFVISGNEYWWFVQSYFFLLLISPILNKAIDNSSVKEHRFFILILTILNIYFGYIWQNPINKDGYNLFNFIYLYVIGRYIGKYISVNSLITIKKKLLLTYTVLSLIFGITVLAVVFIIKRQFLIERLWTYNNPVVIISSILFFCFFLTLKIKNIKINWISTSVLSVYLIHENEYTRSYIYNSIKEICNATIVNNHLFLQFFLVFLLALLLMALCIGFDKLFEKILTPIERLFMYTIDRLKILYKSTNI